MLQLNQTTQICRTSISVTTSIPQQQFYSKVLVLQNVQYYTYFCFNQDQRLEWFCSEKSIAGRKMNKLIAMHNESP